MLETTLVPGLLQTPEYARSMFGRGHQYGGGFADLDEAVAARMARQQVLYQPGTLVHMVATEAVLYFRCAPAEVMAGQLDRLAGATSTQSFRFGIVPSDSPDVKPPLHGFWIYDEDEVQVETLTASLTLAEPSEVRDYLGVFAHYAKAAVYGAEARALIERAAADLG